MAIVLKYRIPQNNQKLGVQQGRLQGVSLEQGLQNELTLLDLTEEGRVVNVIAGPPAELELQITYDPGPRFAVQFPTDEAKVSALRNLWTERISLQLGVLVTALEPTF
jgi:hypothetical protein